MISLVEDCIEGFLFINHQGEKLYSNRMTYAAGNSYCLYTLEKYTSDKFIYIPVKLWDDHKWVDNPRFDRFESPHFSPEDIRFSHNPYPNSHPWNP